MSQYPETPMMILPTISCNTLLFAAVQDYLEYYRKEENPSNSKLRNLENAIFERAIESFYHKEIWQEILALGRKVKR